MGFLSRLFGASEPVPWERMPRNGKTFLERQREPWDKPGNMQIARFELVVTPEDMADKACAWDVPTFFVSEGGTAAFLKVSSMPSPAAQALAASVNAGRATLVPAFSGRPTYPVVPLVFHVPTPERTMKLEAVPDIAGADVRDAIDTLLKDGSGLFYFFMGEPLQLLARGTFTIDTTVLRRCLDKASTHYSSIRSEQLDYRAAVKEYFESTSI
jgi:hypothetical protein